MMMPRFPTLTLGALLALTGCSAGPPPRPSPAPSVGAEVTPPPAAPRRVLLSTDYRATVTADRRDSIIISLPDGSQQVQRVGRHLRFRVEIGADGEVSVRLDSLAATPASLAPRQGVVGTEWAGRLSREGLVGVRVSAQDPLIDGLTTTVMELFPAIPRGGASEGERWAGSSDSPRQVEIFRTTDLRRSTWEVGPTTRRQGIEVMPVSVVEEYEQLGRGEQAGREMRMSAQGVRSATYYVSLLGRIDAIEQRDSAQRLITIPSTRQAVPTSQVSRTIVRWVIDRP